MMTSAKLLLCHLTVGSGRSACLCIHSFSPLIPTAYILHSRVYILELCGSVLHSHTILFILSGDTLKLESQYAQYDCITIMLAAIVETIKTIILPFINSFIFRKFLFLLRFRFWLIFIELKIICCLQSINLYFCQFFTTSPIRFISS